MYEGAREEKMKKIYFLICCIMLICLTACEKKEDDVVFDNTVNIVGDSSHIQDDVMLNDDESAAGDTSYAHATLEFPVFSMSDIETLDGFFCLRSDGQSLIMPEEVSHRKTDGVYSENFEGLICRTLFSPLDINTTEGDKIILIGAEGGNRAQSAMDEMMIYPMHLIGYSNAYMMDEVELDEIQEMQGIDISAVNNDIDAVNQAISSSNISCCDTGSEFGDLVFSSISGEALSYAVYEGTAYNTWDVVMENPYYYLRNDERKYVPIEKTKEGYFIVDMTGLEAGIYAVQSYSGIYAVEIQL